MFLPTFVRRWVRTAQIGSLFVVLAVLSVGCSGKSDEVGRPAATDDSVSTTPVVVVDPPTLPTDVTLPDPAAEEMVSTEKWFTDFDKAKAAADRDGKDMFIEFTGSDWCPPCIQFHETILRYKNFSDYANQRFVLLKLDFPRGETDQTPDERAKNDQLAANYRVDSFPTILLADSKARVYSQFGFQPMTIREFAEHLEQQVQTRHMRDILFAEASTLTGIDRAKKIEEAILKAGAEFALPSYGDELAEIIALDKDGKAGLKDKYAPRLQQHEFSVANSQLQTKLDNMDNLEEMLAEIAIVEKRFADYENGVLQIAMVKAYVYKSKNQVDDLIKTTQPLFANKELVDDAKIQLRVWRMQSLMDTKRYDEASKEMDALAEGYPEQESLQVNVFLFRAKMQVEQGNRDEAKKFVELAKKAVTDSRMRAQIEDYANELLAEPKPLKTDANPKPDDAAKPDDAKKDDAKPTEPPKTDAEPNAAKPTEPAKSDENKDTAKPDAAKVSPGVE